MERTIVLAHGCGVICERCEVADTALTRMRGLLGRRGLARGQGLLIEPTWSVHTWFMRFPIDVVFVDRDLVVLKVVPELPAWRTAACRGAKATFELAAGEAARRGVVPGTGLTLSTINYVQVKGKRSRIEAEIAAISAASKNYKSDNGTYPSSSNTISLTATSAFRTAGPPA